MRYWLSNELFPLFPSCISFRTRCFMQGSFHIKFSSCKESSRVCDYLLKVYPENADFMYFVWVCHLFHRFFFFPLQFTAVGNASHIPSRSLIQHVSGTVELFLNDVMNADIQLCRELMEKNCLFFFWRRKGEMEGEKEGLQKKRENIAAYGWRGRKKNQLNLLLV